MGARRAYGRGRKPGLNRPSKTIKIDLNGVQVAPFGLKLCQNDAPDLRIILGALLDPKTQFKKSKTPKITKIPIFPVQRHQLSIETPDKPLKRLICHPGCGTLRCPCESHHAVPGLSGSV